MKNRPIIFKPELEAIIRKCQTCCIAMVDPEGKPYVIPMNFGFADGHVYFHGSAKGKKVDVLKNKADVCIAFSTDHELRYVTEEVACSWSMRYRSVLVYGKAEFVENPEEKIDILNIIMAHYAERKFEYNAPSIKEVMVFKVRIDKIDGRLYGY
jgi:nitroimidazol reductase NimA-like FMN-containing flavoprotein (pyridoxamine 5'-phosphate oxidase superfamily)